MKVLRVVHGSLEIETRREREVVDITNKIEEWLREIKAKNGILLVYSSHTTMAIVINENEPGLREDIISMLVELSKPNAFWKHNLIDHNAHAHLSSVLIGGERIIPVVNGRLALGTWQRVMVIEMDGPRSRRILLTFIGETES
ncbi:MAG: secondary thiamine-phosphate synthase enzyme YjbQ [Acidilobaceae archaeon]